MTQTTRYSKDPITEALLDFRITPAVNVTTAGLNEAFAAIKSEYPNQGDLVNFVGEVSFGEQAGASAQQIPVGVVRVSEDKKQMVKAEAEGMTFSRLSPYPGWESFRDEARRIWNLYRAYTQPQAINQVSVRYVNRLDLPINASQSVKLEKYLRMYPESPNDLSGKISRFFVQWQIAHLDLQAVAILNEGVVPPSVPDKISVLLDISLVRTADLTTEENFLWELLEQFRLRKNEIFESCITEETRRMLENDNS